MSSSATDLNILALGEFSNLGPAGLEWLTGPLQSLSAVFPIAIMHFNERNGSIIPEFASKQCSVILKLIDYIDDQGSPEVAVSRIISGPGLTQIHAILGPVRSTVAEPISAAASALSIPVVSHWATDAALADKKTYEYFSRTCPADPASANVLADLFAKLGFNKAGMLYVNDDFGAGWETALISACTARNIQLQAIAFDDSTGKQLEECKLIY